MQVINVHRDCSILAAFAAGSFAAGNATVRATFIDTESLH